MAESTTVLVDVDEQVWPAQPGQLASIRAQIRRWLRPLHLTEDAKNDMVLAVNEAVSNAIEHAYTPPTDEDTVRVRFRVEGGTICFEVIDRGTWRTPPVAPAGAAIACRTLVAASPCPGAGSPSPQTFSARRHRDDSPCS